MQIKRTFAVTVLLVLLALSGSLVVVGQHVDAAQAAIASGVTYNPSCKTTGGTIVSAEALNPNNFNPDAIPGGNDQAYDEDLNLYDKLVTLNANYSIVPDLAYNWTISPDGLTYTFNLYHNVTWSDGVPFTSADVVWTIDKLINDSAAYASAYLQDIGSVTAPDNYTVIFHLKQVDPALLGFLAWYGTFILPKHIYASIPDWSNTSANLHPVGTGPFKFVSFTPNSQVVLEANPNYFRGAPCVSKLVFQIIPDSSTALQALINGEVNFDDNNPAFADLKLVNNTSQFATKIALFPDTWYANFNLYSSPFNNSLVREAVVMAINRSEIAQKAEDGYDKPANAFFPIALGWAYDPNATQYSYNITEAAKLLNEAGYPLQPNGTRFSFNFLYFSGAEEDAIATVIQSDLAKVGINMIKDELEFGAWETASESHTGWGMTMLAGFQGPDPAQGETRWVLPGVGNDFGGYNNSQVVHLYQLADSTVNQTQRRQYYFEIQQILVRDAPFVAFVDLAEPYVYSTTLQNVYFNDPSVSYTNFGATWLTTGTPISTSSQSTSSHPTTSSSGPATSTAPPKTSNLTLYVIATIIVVIIVVAIAALVLRRRA